MGKGSGLFNPQKEATAGIGGKAKERASHKDFSIRIKKGLCKETQWTAVDGCSVNPSQEKKKRI